MTGVMVERRAMATMCDTYNNDQHHLTRYGRPRSRSLYHERAGHAGSSGDPGQQEKEKKMSKRLLCKAVYVCAVGAAKYSVHELRTSRCEKL